MKTFFKKLQYCFLLETTKIENAPFPFKTAMSEIEWRLQNRMATTKRTLEPLKKSQFDVPTTQMSIFVFFVSTGV